MLIFEISFIMFGQLYLIYQLFRKCQMKIVYFQRLAYFEYKIFIHAHTVIDVDITHRRHTCVENNTCRSSLKRTKNHYIHSELAKRKLHSKI